MQEAFVEGIRKTLVYNTEKGFGIVNQNFWLQIAELGFAMVIVETALDKLKNRHRIDIIRTNEEHPMIVVRPRVTFCPDCRRWTSGYENWDEHIPACERERERLQEMGQLYSVELTSSRKGMRG
jgi:hypothetical protein